MPLTTGTLDVLAATPSVLRALLASLPDDAVNAPGGEGWSSRDVVAHLLSLEPHTFQGRVRSMLDADYPDIISVDEAELLEKSGYRDRPVGELIELFAAERERSLAMVRDLPDDRLSRAGRHSVAGDVSVADIIHHKAHHDLSHIQQAIALIDAPLEAARGAMRMF